MIITNNEEILRAKCQDVLLEEVDSLRTNLEAELENSARLGRPGIGLAAPQINLHKKMAIVRIDDKHSVDLVNCEIKQGFNEFVFKEEGCLSFPEFISDTKRFSEIYVVNNLVEPHSFIATGLFAVAIQHELDHINGVLIKDRAIKKVVFKAKPNEACPCQSGKKFKKCCGK